MKNIEQFLSLSPHELRSTTGGALFDFFAASPTGGSSVDYTAYATAVGAGYAAMSTGMANFLTSNGAGTAAFLSNFRYPDR
ncbi:hypothetical protein [Chitinophaga japonensis]|uniref:Uncharacterized protein n=1 Tax=Chitinophaga japonensis TaxID=104662 RepID=A0A562SZ06_CHIJA|nr:hypothetical protein [Chitinophaga japonensis]TWI86264.1 hypothetical protein LX66_3517 [Chitinophaga japonensis]